MNTKLALDDIWTLQSVSRSDSNGYFIWCNRENGYFIWCNREKCDVKIPVTILDGVGAYKKFQLPADGNIVVVCNLVYGVVTSHYYCSAHCASLTTVRMSKARKKTNTGS